MCETEIIDCIQDIRNMCIKLEKKQHSKGMWRRHTSLSYIYIKDKHNVCKYGHKTSVQEEGGKLSP